MLGKTALVTGATSGIGRATALALAWAGAKVIACGRREDLLAELVADLGQGGVAAVVDLRSRDLLSTSAPPTSRARPAKVSLRTGSISSDYPSRSEGVHHPAPRSTGELFCC